MGKKEKEKKKRAGSGEDASQTGDGSVTINLLGRTTSLTRSEAYSLYVTLAQALGIEASPAPFSTQGGCPECGATTGCSHMPMGAES